LPLVSQHIPKQHIDSLLVLGRGIDQDGVLSETGFERARVAVEIAQIVLPKVVVFSGGRSWVQVMRAEQPPSEGGAMLDYALQIMDGDEPADVQFAAEEESTSTVGNMVLSKPLLDLDSGNPSIGILSDALHFSQRRIHRLARRVFPGADIVPYVLANDREPTPEAVREERLAARITRAAMFGVAGDDAIMRRHQMIQTVNMGLRRAFATE